MPLWSILVRQCPASQSTLIQSRLGSVLKVNMGGWGWTQALSKAQQWPSPNSLQKTLRAVQLGHCLCCLQMLWARERSAGLYKFSAPALYTKVSQNFGPAQVARDFIRDFMAWLGPVLTPPSSCHNLLPRWKFYLSQQGLSRNTANEHSAKCSPTPSWNATALWELQLWCIKLSPADRKLACQKEAFELNPWVTTDLGSQIRTSFSSGIAPTLHTKSNGVNHIS